MVDAKGRSFPVDVRTRRTLLGDRPAIVVCVRDLTRQKEAEEDRRRFERRVQHAQKMESLGMLAGGIAHDFNNLLTGILGFADLALQEMPAEAPGRDRVSRIMTAARRAADLTSQMLAYTGKAKTQVIPVHLPDLVREMGHLLEVSMSRKHRLEVVTGHGLSPVEADPTQIRQVVMNLIINASEAIGDRPGTIQVSLGQRTCRSEDLAAGEIHDPLPAGEYAFLEVADPGAGIPPEILPRIFEPFFSTKFAGRGLGLAAVMGIVRAHRGTIQVESRPGKGSTFRVWLPVLRHIARTEATRTPARRADAPASWTGHGTVLVIDDEAPIRDLACSMLGRLGFEVVVGRDGLEGLEVFQALSGQIVAVLLDLTMPKLDGRETLARLRRLDPGIPVLLCSGFHQTQARAGLNRDGQTGFLPKPFTAEELGAALQRLLTRHGKRRPATRRGVP
ncbi:MAG: response regulator [Candidatus Riflebacteria bacterium]|nr:response regulator [Candidatus Riflebacteria bacterium]